MTDMKRYIYYIISSAALLSMSSCYKEEPLIPTPMHDELLFEFPQDNKEHDRVIQKLQEDYGTYVIYKDITNNLLNRAWINMYPNMSFVGFPVSEKHIMYYVDYLKNNFFKYFASEDIKKYLPKYFYLLKDMRREENGVAKAHIYTKTDGVDFWALSFQEDASGNIKSFNSKKVRIILAYALIEAAFDEGLIQVPDSFSQGIDYKNPVYNAIYPDGRVHEWHYQLRGFVKYVQPDFEYESPATNISVISMAGEDFLMFVRKILFSTPDSFLEENLQWNLVMKRYQIVLDVFNDMGIDINSISLGE